MSKNLIVPLVAALFLSGCAADLVDYPGNANQYKAELQADHGGDVEDFLTSYQNEVSRLVAFDRIDLLELLHDTDQNYLQANPSDTRFAISKAFWFDKRPVLSTLKDHDANFAQSDILVEAMRRYGWQMYYKEAGGDYRPDVAQALLSDINRIIDLDVKFFVVPTSERVNKALWWNSQIELESGYAYDKRVFTNVGLPGALAYAEAAGFSDLSRLLKSKRISTSGLSTQQLQRASNYGRGFKIASGQEKSEGSTDLTRVLAGAAIIGGAAVIAETGDAAAVSELFAKTAPVFGGQAPAPSPQQSSGLPITGPGSSPSAGQGASATSSGASNGEIMFNYTCPNTGWQKSLPIPATSNPICLAAIKEMVVTQTCNLVDEMDSAFTNYQRQCASEIYQ